MRMRMEQEHQIVLVKLVGVSLPRTPLLQLQHKFFFSTLKTWGLVYS